MHNNVSIRRNSHSSLSNSPEQNITRSHSRESLQENDKGEDAHALQVLTEIQLNTAKELTDSPAVPEQDQDIAKPESVLETEILEIFGDRLLPDRVLAPAVHKHFAVIWGDIIKKGLPTEERKNLLKKLPPPENCIFMDPPKLNPAVKKVLDNNIIKRDDRIIEKQEKVAASLAGVAEIIELILKLDPPEKKQHLELLNRVARILADLQHDETYIRRNLILMNIKQEFRDTLKDLPSDEWLFGKNLIDQIKDAKTLQQSSKDLKPVTKSQMEQDKGSKNSRGPPRRNQFRTNYNSRGGGHRTTYSRTQKPAYRSRSHYPKKEIPSQTGLKKSK
ncbi:uncharacterized protein [Linepithema humile]|uniref:uncharacterized protein n=1 Tax=Linepithema humile TaxID=83485 RepID=UPI00351E78D2